MARRSPVVADPPRRRVPFVGIGVADGFGPWLPPLLLTLLTLGTLIGAYFVRPTVRVDLGDYYDSAFVRNFHGREVDVAAATQAMPWPADSRVVEIPGGRTGPWMVTIHARPGLAPDALAEMALAVNGVRVGLPRRTNDAFVALIGKELTAAPTLRLELVPSVALNPDPPLGVVERLELAPARTYRWSDAESSLVLPGLGTGPWQVDVSLVAMHPDGKPLHAQILVNGAPLVNVPDNPAARRIHMLVPATMMLGGDLELTLRSNTFADPRPLGLLVADAVVHPVETQGLIQLLPPWHILLYALVVVLGAYSCLLLIADGRLRTSPHSAVLLATMARRTWLVFTLCLVPIALGGWALVSYRYPTTWMIAAFAGFALWSLGLLLVLRPLLAWIFRTAGAITARPGSRTTLLHPFAGLELGAVGMINLLLGIFLLSYWLKAGGMLYPYFIAIDVRWHMDRVSWILDGRLGLLYGVNSPLNESTMPTADWGVNRPVIPYSPYFHMFATSFSLLPWPMVFTANMFGALIDSTRLFMIALIARKAGLSMRGTLLAALLYAVLPVAYLLHSWGNIPTTFGLWWVLVSTTFIFVGWRRLGEWLPFLILVFMLLGTLLFYTVTGAFMGFFLSFFTLVLLLVARRTSEPKVLLAGLRPLWLAASVALGLSLIIYYGQYVGPIVERTVPYFGQALTQSSESLGKASDTLSDYLYRHYRLWGYGLAIPLLLALGYLLGGPRRANRPFDDEAPSYPHALLLWVMTMAWVGMTLLFIPIAYKVSMYDKHFFVSIPLVLIAAVATIERFWQRSLAVRVGTVLLYGALAFSAVNLWIYRIINVQQN